MRTKKFSTLEKTLSALMIGIVFVLLNLLLINVFIKKQKSINAALSNKKTELEIKQVLVSERDLWVRRDAWLKENQPTLDNESMAGAQLLTQVENTAKKNALLLENPSFGPINKTEFYTSASINIETKGSWSALIAFLYTLQQPQHFIVMESSDIQIDSTTPSLMRGKFKISKWYASQIEAAVQEIPE